MSEQKEYANGIWGGGPREGAPDFVRGSLSIMPERFIEWLQRQTPNEKGYVRLDILTRKSGDGWSFPLNTYKPSAPRDDTPVADDPESDRAADQDADLPF